MAKLIKIFEVEESEKTKLKIASSLRQIPLLQEDVINVCNTTNAITEDFYTLTINNMHSSDFVNACRDVVKTSELITSYLKDCMKEILLDTQARIEAVSDNSQAYKDDLALSQAAIASALSAFDNLKELGVKAPGLGDFSSSSDSKPELASTTVASDASDSDTPTAVSDFSDTESQSIDSVDDKKTSDPVLKDGSDTNDKVPSNSGSQNEKIPEQVMVNAKDFMDGGESAGRISEYADLINGTAVHNYASGATSTISRNISYAATHDGINSIEPHSGITNSERQKRLAEMYTDGDLPLTKLDLPIWDGEKMDTIQLTVNSNLVDNFTGAFTELAEMKFPVNKESVWGYNHRNIAGTDVLSDHSYGSVVDLNATDNPWHGKPANNQYGVTEDVVNTFAKYGFYWGGDWDGSSTDPMHFTYTGH